MNDEGRRPRRPSANTTAPATLAARTGAVVRALDALELDDQREATEILLAALEAGPSARRCRCSFCGCGFEWPGLLDAHYCHRKAAA